MARRRRIWIALGTAVAVAVVAVGGFVPYRSVFGGPVPEEVTLNETPAATSRRRAPGTSRCTV
jgi:hypothetical protein